jgi:hypothetical protein
MEPRVPSRAAIEVAGMADMASIGNWKVVCTYKLQTVLHRALNNTESGICGE